MHIGLPREIKDGEFRAALTPGAAGVLARAGHGVTVEPGVGAIVRPRLARGTGRPREAS